MRKLKLLPKRIIASFVAASALTFIAASGWLYTLNNQLSDALYQHGQLIDGKIAIIGIDQKSLELLGPFVGWGRGMMAEAVDILNADPSSKPAVIGLDIFYIGESTDPDGDAALANACANGQNVVAAGAAYFDSEIVEDGDSFYINDYSVTSIDNPYPALLQQVDVGYINSMFDNDGILRHGILNVELNDGTLLPSFHSVISRQYCEQMGIVVSTPPTDSRHRWYVPFLGKPDAYNDGYSFYDLISGEIDPSVFQDKIVLIGPYAVGMQDDFPTSIDHAQKMYGVEYQANMIDTIIGGEFKTEVDFLPQLIALFVICFFTLMFLLGRRVLTATVVWLALTGGSILVFFLAYEAGFLLAPVYVPASISILYIASVAINYIRAAVDKRHVTKTFERYVAPEIVGELLRENSDQIGLGGKLCDIAVLFVDIRGFTTMSEELAPSEIVAILNQYLTLTSECIFNNGGTLDKFIGDCTMAFWGAPLQQEDCVFKAIKAALDMVEGARELSIQLQKTHGRTVGFGIGVSFGPAVVGNIGSPNRMDYTAIGDTVNTASRLEANAPAGQILVSRAVSDALEGRVLFTSLGDSIKLKGKAEGFEILRVEGIV